MADRIRAVFIFVVVLAAGGFFGMAWMDWRGGDPEAAARQGPRPDFGVGVPGRIRVEVLNGGGVPDMARRATTALREQGLDVVYFGNASRFGRDSSLVLDRVGEQEAARKVADALGIRSVGSAPDSNLYLDVTVFLGSDWRPEHAAGARTEDEGTWWDLGRLFQR